MILNYYIYILKEKYIMTKKILEETEQAIINDYVNNVSIPEIAKKYNISSSTVHLIKKRYNIPNRAKHTSTDDYDDNRYVY